MHEHFTEALILDNQDKNELDALITLYTADFGKVAAYAKSAKKITSKLAGHLQPLNFANIRLIEKNASPTGRQGFQIVDALTTSTFDKSRKNPENLKKFLNIAEFIKNMTYELQEDRRLWQAIKKIMASDFEERIIYLGIIKILGFDPEFADCRLCHNDKIKYFLKTDHIFLCKNCGLKNNQNDVILIK